MSWVEDVYSVVFVVLCKNMCAPTATGGNPSDHFREALDVHVSARVVIASAACHEQRESVAPVK